MAENEDTKETRSHKKKKKKDPVDMTPPSKPTGHNRLSPELLYPGPNYSNKYAWIKQTSNVEKERYFEHIQLFNSWLCKLRKNKWCTFEIFFPTYSLKFCKTAFTLEWYCSVPEMLPVQYSPTDDWIVQLLCLSLSGNR